MARTLCLFLCFCSFSLGQTLGPAAHGTVSSSSPVEILYVLDSATITTYNIDQHTFEATLAGTTAMSKSKYASLVTSPNGRFLYYLANYSTSTKDQKLFVYDTDAMGVPGNTPVQALGANQLSAIAINPTGTFSYSVTMGPVGETTQFSIVRNVINSNNGSLSQPVTEATYQLDTESSGNDCSLAILGFNPDGTTMYDGIFCNGPHASGSSTYNQRAVNLETGTLGPDEQVYGFSYYAGSGFANVQFENNLLFAFVEIGNLGPNMNYVDAYQLPNTTSPTVECTASMLADCGDFGFSLAHPSGEYVFLGASDTVTDIDSVNLGTQQIVEVNSLPFRVWAFSPGGKIAYGMTDSLKDVYIAGFNPANGSVKLGGIVKLSRVFDTWYVAERD